MDNPARENQPGCFLLQKNREEGAAAHDVNVVGMALFLYPKHRRRHNNKSNN